MGYRRNTATENMKMVKKYIKIKLESYKRMQKRKSKNDSRNM